MWAGGVCAGRGEKRGRARSHPPAQQGRAAARCPSCWLLSPSLWAQSGLQGGSPTPLCRLQMKIPSRAHSPRSPLAHSPRSWPHGVCPELLLPPSHPLPGAAPLLESSREVTLHHPERGWVPLPAEPRGAAAPRGAPGGGDLLQGGGGHPTALGWGAQPGPAGCSHQTRWGADGASPRGSQESTR